MAFPDITGSTFGPLGNAGPSILDAPSTFQANFGEPAFFATNSGGAFGGSSILNTGNIALFLVVIVLAWLVISKLN